MSNLYKSDPVLASLDIIKSVEFFEQKLGFTDPGVMKGMG
jgi:hypothetical protein